MRRESGFTLIELLVVVAIVGILASMAVMSLVRARGAANEASAIQSMRTIASGQIVYSSSCGRGNFAVALTTLRNVPAGQEGFVPPDLGAANVVQKAGYLFQLRPSVAAAAAGVDCMGVPVQTGYVATGEPLMFGTTGQRSFSALSPTGVIWENDTAVAPAEPFAPPSRVIR